MLLYQWLSEVARKQGSAKALAYRDTYFSWRGLLHRVDRRAQELAAMGIGKGHWVGLMLGNVPDFAILALGLSKIGATVVPLDPTLGARDLGAILEAVPLRGLVTRPRGGVDQLPSIPTTQQKGTRGRNSELIEVRRRLQGTLLTCALYKRTETHPLDVEAVLFTAGSRGEPKGVLRSADNLLAGTAQLQQALELTSEDSILTTVPLYQAYGFDIGLTLSLCSGAALHLEDDLAPRRVAKILREQEIAIFPGTPVLYAGLAQAPLPKPIKNAGRARYLSSGSALPEITAEAFRSRWGIRILGMYHTTEAHAVALDRKGQHPDSVGKAIDGVEVRVDSSGRIWVRSAAVATRSLRAVDDMTRADADVPIGTVDDKGWYRTGDLGRIDRSGRLYLTGREDALVKVEGHRVALSEIDACLQAFAKVKAARTVLVDDPLGGPVIVARVVTSEKCQAEELIDHCARHLAPYKVPRRIEFRERL